MVCSPVFINAENSIRRVIIMLMVIISIIGVLVGLLPAVQR